MSEITKTTNETAVLNACMFAAKAHQSQTRKGDGGARWIVVVPLKNCINFPFCGVLSFGGFKPISFLFASPLCF